MSFTSRLQRLLRLEFLDVMGDFTVDMRGDAFSRVTERLFVGGRPEREDVAELEEAGVTHVVSCLEQARLARVGFLETRFQTAHFALSDSMDQDIAACFPAFFEFASRAFEAPAAKLLVHCEAGVSRSATLAAAWLMKSQQQTFRDAFAQLRTGRPGVLPNIGFASQLQRLEHTLPTDRAPTEGPSSLARYLREVCQAPVEVEVLEEVLGRHDGDAPRALRAIFGGEIPRGMQGVRL